MRKFIIGWALALVLALGASAQSAAAVHLATTYTPDSWLLYSVSIQTEIVSRSGTVTNVHGKLTTQAVAQLHVLPGATANNYEIAARFTKYSTTISADSGTGAAALREQSQSADAAALAMKPARFRMANGSFSIVSRQPGGEYDQAVDMLGELVRNDDLPTGPVTVGAQWTRNRSRAIPQTTVMMPLSLHCRLSALGSEGGEPTATIAIQTSSSVNLPPGFLANSQQLASQGLVPMGKFSFNTQATSVYRAADGVLLSTQSETHSTMHIQFIGPSPQAQTSDADIHSTGTVELEKILKAPHGGAPAQ